MSSTKLLNGQTHAKLNKRKAKLDARTPEMIKDRVINLHTKYAMQPTDIAKVLEVKPEVVHDNISTFLKEFREEKESVESFKLDRAEVFAAVQLKSMKLMSKIVDSVNVDELAPKDKSFMITALNNAIGTLYDKERIERGQTSNTTSTLAVIIQQVSNERLNKEKIIEHESNNNLT